MKRYRSLREGLSEFESEGLSEFEGEGLSELGME